MTLPYDGEYLRDPRRACGAPSPTGNWCEAVEGHDGEHWFGLSERWPRKPATIDAEPRSGAGEGTDKGETSTEVLEAAKLHSRLAHPLYEYDTTTGPRKCWDVTPPEGEGWEPNVDFNDGFERFDHHEEAYWRRPKLPAPSAADVVADICQRGCGVKILRLGRAHTVEEIQRRLTGGVIHMRGDVELWPAEDTKGEETK